MEGKRYLFIFLFGLMSITLFGQQNQTLIYDAFISGKMTSWKEVIDNMEKTAKKSNDFTLELVNYQVGYIGYCLSEEKYDEARAYIDLAESNLENLQDKKFKPSYIFAYQGAINGFKIGLNQLTALYYGVGIVSKAEDAIRLDPKNPNGYILLGNSKYYMWAMLGGSKEAAIMHYKTAEKIMEDEKLVEQNWYHLTLLTMIAHAYVEMGEYKNADLYYKKIMRVEPDYKWVKEELYPEFLKDHKEHIN